MPLRKLAIATAVAVLASSLDCAAANAYSVATTLLHGGQRYAMPTAVVAAGTPATIAVDGAQGYRLSVAVEEIAEGKLKVRADLASPYGAMSPVLVVRPGQPATVNVGDMGMVMTVARKDD